MTREEAIKRLRGILTEAVEFENSVCYVTEEDREPLEMAIKVLEQEPKTRQFAKWVATEIFDDNWEYNKNAFAEIACRKLAKLGIVRAKDGEWELIESEE